MIAHNKNFMADLEPLLKEKCHHLKNIIIYIEEKKTTLEKSNPSIGEAWNKAKEKTWIFNVTDHLNATQFLNNQIASLQKEMLKYSGSMADLFQVSPLLEGYSNKLEAEITLLQESFNKKEWENLDKALIQKKIFPEVIYKRFADRYPDEKKATPVIIPKKPLRLRFVYADSPNEPIANSHILYWLYKEDSLESKTLRFNKKTNVMTGVGIGLTDRNGYLIQSIPLLDPSLKGTFNPEVNQLKVRYDITANDIHKISNQFQKAEKKNPAANFDRAAFPSVETLAVSPSVHGEDPNKQFFPEGMNPENILEKKIQDLKNLDDVLQPESKKLKPVSQIILETFVFHGFSDKDMNKINALEAFQENPDCDQTLNDVSLQYFTEGKTYGFMVYPANRGPFATKDLTTLPDVKVEEPEQKNAPKENLAKPDAENRVAWKGKLKNSETKNGESMLTIALHCTLPQWDLRLSSALQKLVSTIDALSDVAHPHEENLSKLAQMQNVMRWHMSYSYEKLNKETKKKGVEFTDAIRDLEEEIIKNLYDPKNQNGFYVKAATDEKDRAAEAVKKILDTKAFYDEFRRYREHAFIGEDNPAEPTEYGEKDGVVNAGPYMQQEPFWVHVFDTISKSNAALSYTSLRDKIWKEYGEEYVYKILNMSNNLDLGVTVKSEKEVNESNERFNYQEPDENSKNPNVLDPLIERLQNAIIQQFLEPSEKITNSKNKPSCNSLLLFPAVYMKSGSIFHNVPGPPSALQVFLDCYADKVSLLITKKSIGENSAHIKVLFSVMKQSGLLPKGSQFIDFKDSTYTLLRAHGRPYNRRMQYKAKPKQFPLSRIFPKSADGRINISRGGGSFSDNIYSARNHFQYKSVMQVFNLMLMVEAFGNLSKSEAQNMKEALTYAAEVVTFMGDTTYNACNMLILSQKMLSGLHLSSYAQNPKSMISKLSVSTLDRSKSLFASKNIQSLENIAENIGCYMGVLCSIFSSFQAIDAYFEGREKEMRYKIAQSIAGLMTTTGYLMEKQKIKTLERILSGYFLKGTFLLKMGSVLTVALVLYDLYEIAKNMVRSDMYDWLEGNWELFNKSQFHYWKKGVVEKPSSRQQYYEQNIQKKVFVVKEHSFNTKEMYIQKSTKTKNAYRTINSLIEGAVFRSKSESQLVDFLFSIFLLGGHLNWRAVIPMHVEGYTLDEINVVVTITGAMTDLEKRIEMAEPLEELMSEKEKNRMNVKRKEMTPKAIIDFYKELKLEEDKKFSSGKEYKKVVKELQDGTFTPNKETPELLDVQIKFNGKNHHELKKEKNNNHLSYDLIIGDWSSKEFYLND